MRRELLKGQANWINCTDCHIQAVVSEQSMKQQAFCPEHCTLTDGMHINTLSIASLCQPVLFCAVLQVYPGYCCLSWTDIPKDQSGDLFSLFSAVSAAGPGTECSLCLQLSKEPVINSAEIANYVTVSDVFIAHLRVHDRPERSFRGST